MSKFLSALIYSIGSSVNRFGEISPLWQHFIRALHFFRLGYYLNLCGIFIIGIGQIITVVIGQIFKNDLAIWSHWFTRLRSSFISTIILKLYHKQTIKIFLAALQSNKYLYCIADSKTIPTIVHCFGQTVSFSGIQTWIIGGESKDADNLTTNTAQYIFLLTYSCYLYFIPQCIDFR